MRLCYIYEIFPLGALKFTPENCTALVPYESLGQPLLACLTTLTLRVGVVYASVLGKISPFV